MTTDIALSARRATVAVLTLAAVAVVTMAGTAHAKSEYAVFSVSVEGQGAGAWLNPVGEGCVGPAQQSALRGSMRESLRLRTPTPTLVTVSGLNGRSGPMRVMPLDRRVSAPAVQAEVTRSGQAEYLDCRKDLAWTECPEVASRTRPACHAPRPVAGLDACFGTRTFATALGIRFESGTAALVISPPSGLDSTIFGCEPEDMSFRPSALIPGATSLKTRVALPRRRLQRAKAGTVLVLRGPHQAGPDAVDGCKAPAPATCEPYAGELTVELRFVCRARRTTESCAGAKRPRPR
jgi:hypothetical protein